MWNEGLSSREIADTDVSWDAEYVKNTVHKYRKNHPDIYVRRMKHGRPPKEKVE